MTSQEIQTRGAAATERLRELHAQFAHTSDLGTQGGLRPGWWLSEAAEHAVRDVPQLVEEVHRIRAQHPVVERELRSLWAALRDLKRHRDADALTELGFSEGESGLNA